MSGKKSIFATNFGTVKPFSFFKTHTNLTIIIVAALLKLFFCIGDVSGKGMPSAMLMAGTRSFFRAFSGHENNPGLIMQYINESACQGNDTNMFVTLFIGVLDLPTGHLRYCNAGHDVPLILANGQWTCLEAKPHLPIGLFDEMKYNMMETYLQPNSTIFLYTDGLTEAKNCERKQFGIKQVEEVLATCTDTRPQELLETIDKAVRGFVGGAEQSDDLTMLAIRYTPQQYESAEERQVGGLGILLVRELMDTINYEHINGHNILTLSKKTSLS